jgi:allophanate hydrolase subunit 2
LLGDDQGLQINKNKSLGVVNLNDKFNSTNQTKNEPVGILPSSLADTDAITRANEIISSKQNEVIIELPDLKMKTIQPKSVSKMNSKRRKI